MMCGMRPLRFTLFLAVLAGLLSAAGYLWAPLVGPSAPQLRFSPPTLQWSVLPLRITAVSLPNRAELRSLPLRVGGSFLLYRGQPEPNQVSLHLPTPTAVAAKLPVKQPAHAPVAHIPADSQPSTTPAAAATPAVPAVPAVPGPVVPPAPAVLPATPTPRLPIPLAPIPLPPALQPAAPATPPTPDPLSPPPQPALPATQPPPANPPPALQPVAPATPPVPSPAPTPTPVSEPPPPATSTQTPTTPAPTPPPTPELQTRPGRGCGDHNHIHTGPPGNPAGSPC